MMNGEMAFIAKRNNIKPVLFRIASIMMVMLCGSSAFVARHLTGGSHFSGGNVAAYDSVGHFDFGMANPIKRMFPFVGLLSLFAFNIFSSRGLTFLCSNIFRLVIGNNLSAAPFVIPYFGPLSSFRNPLGCLCSTFLSSVEAFFAIVTIGILFFQSPIKLKKRLNFFAPGALFCRIVFNHRGNLLVRFFSWPEPLGRTNVRAARFIIPLFSLPKNTSELPGVPR